MVLFACLWTVALSVSQAKVCLFDLTNRTCPADSTHIYEIWEWSTWHAQEEKGFGLTGNVSLTFYVDGDVPAWMPISVRLPYGGIHNLTFQSIGGSHVFTLDFTTTTAATNYHFIGCIVVVPEYSTLGFDNLVLENSSFGETADVVFARHSLTADLYSAANLGFLSADRVTLLFEKAYWPRWPAVIRIGKLVPVHRVIIGGLDHAIQMTIFGDLFLFQRTAYASTLYFDVTESITAPRVELDKKGGQLAVSCEYYVPKYYDPPIVEFRLETDEPLIFENSAWPVWLPNLVLVTTRGRAGQNLWIRAPRMPVTIKTWYNISDAWKPTGDPALKDNYLTELRVFADSPSVQILGRVQAQASDVHFDSHLPGRVNLTIFDLVEYGMLIPNGNGQDKGVFPRAEKTDLHVFIFAHEKHETMNTSSKFGGNGTWEWEYFPYTQASTGVGHLVVESDRVYDVFYGHNHTYGDYTAPLCNLRPEEGHSSITFSNPAHPVLRIRPLYYFQEFNRPSDDELDDTWLGIPTLLYFHDVLEEFHVEIDLPETGVNGFEPSTYFFDFVWDSPNRAVRMLKREAHLNTYNYKFCWAGSVIDTRWCPKGFAVIRDIHNITSYVRPIAKQLRFAILEHFDLCPIFDYFTNVSIDVSVFSPHSIDRPNLTVPVDFLHGRKFGETHLANITLRLNDTHVNQVTLSDVTHLDLHNVTIDRTLHDSLSVNGCNGTPRIEADPYSYSFLLDRCRPDVLFLDEGRFDQVIFAQDRIILNHTGFSSGHLDINTTGGRPSFVEIIYHDLKLKIDLALGVTHIPQTVIFQPDIPGEPEYTFNDRWTPSLAGNLTIDNLLGTFYVNTPFVPFRPGALIRVPTSGRTGVRIHGDGDKTYVDGVRVYYPFPDYARVNPGTWGELLRYEDVDIIQPLSLDGEIEKVIFAGNINFSLGAGINVHEASFDPHKPPTINIEFRLQGGLPRINLGTSQCPMETPAAVNLIHRGPSEKAFIQRHPAWFRQFSHEIVCGNESLPCNHWRINFKSNHTEDPAGDHSEHSVLRTVCRLENEGQRRICLAIEIDEFYFPLPSASPAATWSPFQTFPPPPTYPPPPHTQSPHATHTPFQSGHEPSKSANRSPLVTQSPKATHTHEPSANAGGGSVSNAAQEGGSKLGAGIAVGIVVALVIAAAAAAAVYFLFIRQRVPRDGYDNVDLDGKQAVSL